MKLFVGQREGSPLYRVTKLKPNIMLTLHSDIIALVCFCYRLNVLGLSIHLSDIPLLVGNELYGEIYQHFKDSYFLSWDFET